MTDLLAAARTWANVAGSASRSSITHRVGRGSRVGVAASGGADRMSRRFNTAGPCVPALHYMIPALSRLPAGPGLVDQNAYFVVHAPRQTGKTTALRALARELTDQGRYAALHFSCEEGEAAGDNYAAA